MKKKGMKIIIVVIILIAGVIFFQGKLFDVIGISDGYTTIGSYLELTGKTSDQSSTYWTAINTGFDPVSTDQDVLIRSGDEQKTNQVGNGVRFSEPFNKKRIRMEISYHLAPTSLGGVFIRVVKDVPGAEFGGNILYEDSIGNSNVAVSDKTLLVESIPNIFDNTTSIFISGVKVMTINTPDPQYIDVFMGSVSSGSGYFHVKNTRYQPLFSCSLDAQDVSAIQTFNAGDVITLRSFQYPVKQFCTSHPLEVITSSGTDVDTSNNIYTKLVQGLSATVKDGQLWTFHYVVDNSKGLIKVACPSGTEVDQNGICKQQTALIYVLSQGELHPDGTFTIEPQTVCESLKLGGRWEEINGTGVCIINQPVQEYCAALTGCDLRAADFCDISSMTYESPSQLYPSGRCVSNPVTVQQNTSPVTKMNYMWFVYIIGGIIVLIALYELFKKK